MKILIVKLSSVGDVIHALPVAAALKRRWPDSSVTWVVETAARSLVENHQYIDEIIVFDKARKADIGYLRSFAKVLRLHRYDYCIDLQGLAKSALIALCVRATRKIGWYNMREGSWLVSKRTTGPCRKEHVVERYLDVVRTLGAEVPMGVADFGIGFSEREISAAEKICCDNGLNLEDCKYAVLASGSMWQTKRWPTGCFGELAALLAKDGFVPVLVGASNECELAAEVVEAFKVKCAGKNSLKIINLTGKTSLKELAYVVSKAQIFVGNDSGPLHLAVAVGTYCVALFGPTNVERTGPYGKQCRVICTECLKCGCMKRECPLQATCMQDISPKIVQRAVTEILERTRECGDL